MTNFRIHTRRSIRLKGYDYSQEGLYFITICVQDKICRFGHIENGKMIYNQYGTIAHNVIGVGIGATFETLPFQSRTKGK